MKQQNEHGYCDNCGMDFDGGLIWDTIFNSCKSEEEADKRAMEFYKATRTHGRWGKHIAVYDMEKDRTVSFMCPQCEHKWARTEKDR